MNSWEAVSANPSVQQALYYISGLGFLLQPNLELIWSGYRFPVIYCGFNNGLVYFHPSFESSDSFNPIDYEEDVCEGVEFTSPVENPPPFKGYDVRCRPWFQHSMTEKISDAVMVGDPYIFFT